MSVCIGCDHRDETIEHHAKIIAQLKREKMAYRAALIEVVGDVDHKTVLQKHMERLDV